MKHEQLAFLDLLRRLRDETDLLPDERMRVEHILLLREARNGRTEGAPRGGDLLTEVRLLVHALVGRGYWDRMEGSGLRDEESIVVRDPRRRVRYRLRLTEPTVQPPQRLDVPTVEDSDLPARVTRALVASPGEIVGYDRILSPREILSKMEVFLREVVPAREATFYSLEDGPDSGAAGPVAASPTTPAEAHPGTSLGTSETSVEGRLNGSFPLSPQTVQGLSKERSTLYRWSLRDHGVARLALAIGDDILGWRGVVVLEGDSDFDAERILAAVWTTTHFEGLVSTVMRLQGLIFYDFLTGVYNRSFYEDQMDRELQLARRRQEPMALLLLDIDDFKDFNTRYGYEGGDRVLATVACILKSALRATDTMARYGGEEFVVILAPPVSTEEAFRIADRLRQAVEEEEFRLPDFSGNEVTAHVSVSIGGALFPRHGETRVALWTASNVQLLRAKDEGKNRVLFPD